MKKTPKSLRLHIGIFGRTNVGKSSFLNFITGQDTAITSPLPGTTTDVVEKTMELLPVGPVVFIDTAGIDDTSSISHLRTAKTKKVFDRTDVAIIVTEPGVFDKFEEHLVFEFGKRKVPVITVINKTDLSTPTKEFIEKIKNETDKMISLSSISTENRNNHINRLKSHLISLVPEDFLSPPPLIRDLLVQCGLCVLIVPIDLEAPKGRIILPQVQAIRDVLDNNSIAIIVKETEYKAVLQTLNKNPDIVICDSQVIDRMVTDTPPDVKCSTFSILFSRYKGDIVLASMAVTAIDRLKKNDSVLIAEACSHHPLEDDIGRIKIPNWLEQYLGFRPEIEICSGRDFPGDLSKYSLIIHCGACMINRREMLSRIQYATEAGIPMTNYGICISHLRGLLKRVLTPFPEALATYEKALEISEEMKLYEKNKKP